MAIWRPWNSLSCLQVLLLAVFHANAYVSVNLERHCNPDISPFVLYLQPQDSHVAALVDLNIKDTSEDKRCQLEIKAPPSHLLTVHLVPNNEKQHYNPPVLRRKQGFQPCFLKITPLKEDNAPSKRLAKTVDICDNAEIPVNTLVLTNHLALTWSPPDPFLGDMMISRHLVITAVGRGAEICSSRNRMLCLSSHLHLCIPSNLACDGFHNCPIAGEDEDPRSCAATAALMHGLNHDPHQMIGDFLTKAVVKAISLKSERPRNNNTTSDDDEKKTSAGLELTPVFHDVSSFIKSLLNNHKTTRVEPNITDTTTTTTVKPPWLYQPPKTLAHYGPWGYLMLGMLICGAILMLCGLWECCCRASKHRLPPGGPMSNSAATTVFIINSPPHRNHVRQTPEEPPSTPGPPSYEELDQPPPYSSLFPVTKQESSEVINLEENPVISGDHI